MLREWARLQREEMRDRWEGGHFLEPQYFESVVKGAAAAGACSVYRDIEAMDFETILGDQRSEQPSRAEDGKPDDAPGEAGGY